MQRPRDEFLSRARFSPDEDRKGTPRGVPNSGPQAMHLGTATQQASRAFIMCRRLPLEHPLDLRRAQDSRETNDAADSRPFVTRDLPLAKNQKMSNGLATGAHRHRHSGMTSIADCRQLPDRRRR